MKKNEILAYIAGFMDGEGCVDIKNCSIILTQNKLEPLEFVQKYFGGRISEKWRDSKGHDLKLHGDRARLLAKSIYSYSIVKKDKLNKLAKQNLTGRDHIKLRGIKFLGKLKSRIEKKDFVVAMREQGYSFGAIGKMLGLSYVRAWQIYTDYC